MRLSSHYAALALAVLIGTNATAQTDKLIYDDEKHFKNVKQLTFGGDNAEAYFSFDGKAICFQRTNAKEGLTCDQIFYGKLPKKGDDKFEYKQVSHKGRTTCSYMMPDGA